MRSHAVLFLLLLLLVAPALRGEEKPKGYAFFEKKIRPVLVEHCQDCHGSDEAESGLRVDSLAGLLKGGMHGPAIVPGDPKKSLLILAVNHADQQLHMPPKRKLPTRTLLDLAQWIKMGAPWPNAKLPAPAAKASATEYVITEKQRRFWSFQPPRTPPLPAVQATAWPRNGIDHFVLARLEKAGFQPALPADRRTLIRRATLDLTGLPPTPDELQAFLADRSPNAYDRLIDRLLNSPRYGERWGRHWLDVARYADSNGLDENLAYANAFRYRDYVVQAFNKDKSFRRFVIEQLAGDRLGAKDPVPVSERITATGFLSIGAKMLAEDDPVKMQMDIIDEQIDTTARAFMGLTLGCARCHDHKFDPIPTADYYSLAGIFKSTKTMENFKVVAVWQERPVGDPKTVAERTKQEARIKSLKKRIEAVVAEANATAQKTHRRFVESYVRQAAARSHIDELVRKLTGDGKATQIKAPPEAIVREAETFERGNLTKLSDGYGKGIGVIAGPGGRNHCQFDVQVERAGLYHVVYRYAAAQSRPTDLLLNGRVVLPGTAGKVTGSWYPDTQKWFVEGAISLPAGKAVIGLERMGPIPHIDKIVFLPLTGGRLQTAKARLQPLFLQQWSDYLRRTSQAADTPLAAWHALAAGKPLAGLKGSARKLAGYLKLVDGMSPEQVSVRYAQAFARAESGWQALLRKDPRAKSLADESLESLRQVLYSSDGPFRAPKSAEALYPANVQKQLRQQREKLAAEEKAKITTPVAMAVSDARPENVRIHIRGNHVTLGQEVPRRFPRILAPKQGTANDGGSGRLALARWMTRPDHPLTSRVIVNRVWHWHFGKALVRSLDNFGRLGQLPTHPQLLDYLATWLVRHDWSLKELHRQIMLSATYRMSTRWNADYAGRDPENRLIWRMNRRRLEAEAIRDSLLAIGQTVDFEMGGTLLRNKNREYVTSSANVDPAIYRNRRRSVYLPIVRSALYDVFQAFDFADPSVLNGKREATTVAAQALFMMNSDFVAAQTRALAERLMREHSDTPGRVKGAYQVILLRAPNAAEARRAANYVETYRQRLLSLKKTDEESRRMAWQSLCRVLVSSNDFIFLD